MKERNNQCQAVARLENKPTDLTVSRQPSVLRPTHNDCHLLLKTSLPVDSHLEINLKL